MSSGHPVGHDCRRVSAFARTRPPDMTCFACAVQGGQKPPTYVGCLSGLEHVSHVLHASICSNLPREEAGWQQANAVAASQSRPQKARRPPGPPGPPTFNIPNPAPDSTGPALTALDGGMRGAKTISFQNFSFGGAPWLTIHRPLGNAYSNWEGHHYCWS